MGLVGHLVEATHLARVRVRVRVRGGVRVRECIIALVSFTVTWEG